MKIFKRKRKWILALNSTEYWTLRKQGVISEWDFRGIVTHETDGTQYWTKFTHEREFSTREELVFWRLSNSV